MSSSLDDIYPQTYLTFRKATLYRVNTSAIFAAVSEGFLSITIILQYSTVYAKLRCVKLLQMTVIQYTHSMQDYYIAANNDDSNLPNI